MTPYTRRSATFLVLAWLAGPSSLVMGAELPRAYSDKVRFLAHNDLDAADAQVVGKLLDSGFFAKVHEEWNTLQSDQVSPAGGPKTQYEIKEQVKEIGLPIARVRFTPFSGQQQGNYGYFDPGPKREGLLKKKSNQFWELPICRYDYDGYLNELRWRRVATITVDVIAGKVYDVRWD